MLAIGGAAVVHGAPRQSIRGQAEYQQEKQEPKERGKGDNILERLENQRQKIARARGQFAPGEELILQENLSWVRFSFGNMQADGRLDDAELNQLKWMLDQNVQMIENKRGFPTRILHQADIPQRIHFQQWRINEGVASGELTRGEAEILQDNLNWIRSAFMRMKADGRLTPAEIGRLNQMLDQNSAMIFNKKHNPVRRAYQAEIPERIADQQWRINDGIAAGELTRGEADVLLDNLNWIRTTFSRMKADGRLSPAEIEKMDRMLDQNSIMIFNKRHNPVRRLY